MDNELRKYKAGFVVSGNEYFGDEEWVFDERSTTDKLIFLGYDFYDVDLPEWLFFEENNALNIKRVNACKEFAGDFKGDVFMDGVCVSKFWKKNDIESNNVVNPNHYRGNDGLMAIDVMKNFMTAEQLEGYYLGNTFKYMLRFQKKNGLEDLYKAREHLNWLIANME